MFDRPPQHPVSTGVAEAGGESRPAGMGDPPADGRGLGGKRLAEAPDWYYLLREFHEFYREASAGGNSGSRSRAPVFFGSSALSTSLLSTSQPISI